MFRKTKGGAGGQIDFPSSLFRVKAKIFLKTLIKNLEHDAAIKRKTCLINLKNTQHLGTQWSLEVATTNLQKSRYKDGNAKFGLIIFSDAQIKECP